MDLHSKALLQHFVAEPRFHGIAVLGLFARTLVTFDQPESLQNPLSAKILATTSRRNRSTFVYPSSIKMG